jgi:hypothetical protein
VRAGRIRIHPEESRNASDIPSPETGHKLSGEEPARSGEWAKPNAHSEMNPNTLGA